MRLKISLLITVLMISQILVGVQPSKATNESTVNDLIIYENIPEVDPEFSDQGTELKALYLHKEGHFTEVSLGLNWKSSNTNVATVDDNGRIEFTGQRGRTFISVTDGNYTDRIGLHNKANPAQKSKSGNSPNLIEVLKESGDRYQVIDRSLDSLTIEEKIGQMMMPDFRHYNGEAVTEMLPEIEELVEEYHLGGVILFAENVVGTEQTSNLVSDYQETADKFGLLVTIDQEGGIVTRLQTGTHMPGNMALGATRSNELATQVGDVIGAELSALGINTNLAPVVDVNNNSDNPVIGVRSFGEDPELVANMGVNYIKGLQQNGIAATAKHFPGHGDTAVDSHLGLPEVPHDKERLLDVELYPFQKAMDHGIDAIMTAHVTFPQIDGSKAISQKDGTEISIPATLSRKVLTDLMRDEMGYEGVVMTDAMNMNAITDHFGSVDAAIRAINAGADIILMPVGLEAVVTGVLDAVNDGDIELEEIDQSVKRILTLKVERGIFKTEETIDREKQLENAIQTIGSDVHRAIEQEVAEKSITMVKNDDVLPLSLEDSDEVVVVGTSFIAGLTSAIEKHHDNVTTISLSSQRQLTSDQEALIENADQVIIGSYTFNVAGRSPGNANMHVFNQILDMKEDVVGVGIRNPYDIIGYPDVDAYLAQYGFRDASFQATADTIFGDNNPTGQLPVTIPDFDEGVLYPYGTGINYE
ncbi:beta-N-acetylhexosaminidase [Salipaludibacillus neizhouensis]|uniref:beta-N-acetylhexosaminidase n=1 Tax=Salipaludibacillus neizhouensis TaxID=885475 RepID=A0A3A9KG24_9BACI|nr:beta-N-acetylhexosaminidase [Salipaludibacillus neizhouensis]RKL66595.1 beta-N-acetylhexosaminidase [Salipaludibacillus neizhouensis]